MKHDRTDWIERGKSILIVLLTLSALFLVTRTGFGQQWSLSARLNALTGETVSDMGTDLDLPSGFLPVAAALTGDEGRYGVQYDPDRMDELFSTLQPMLGVALSQRGAPTADDQWTSALEENGVFLEFLSPISLDVLTAWLNQTELRAGGSACALRLIVTGDSLWYQDEAGGWYRCAVDGIEDLMAELTETVYSNGAQFAFESPVYEAAAPCSLIVPGFSAVNGYLMTNPLNEQAGLLAQQVRLLGFNPHGLYTTMDGAVVKDGADSLRVQENASILCVLTSDRLPVTTQTGRATLSEATLAAWQLAERTVGQSAGEGRVVLSHTETNGDGSYTFTFSYLLDGCRVLLSDAEAAVITVEGGAVTECALRYCSFTASGASTPVLPFRQAAAALAARFDPALTLRLSYRESGGQLTPGWYAE